MKACENNRNELDRPEGIAKEMSESAILRKQSYYRGRIDGIFFCTQFPEMLLEATAKKEGES